MMMRSFTGPIRVLWLAVVFIANWWMNLEAQTTSENSHAALERETFALINEYRKSSDLPILTWDEEIAKIGARSQQGHGAGRRRFRSRGF